MKTREERIELVTKNLVKSSYPIVPLGGQHCGVSTGISLYSQDLDIDIKVNNFRSQFKNMELAKTLMSLAIEELIKK